MVFWPKICRYYKLEHGKLAELINNGLTILITGQSEPAQEKWFNTYKPFWFTWLVICFQAHFGCHDILMLG